MIGDAVRHFKMLVKTGGGRVNPAHRSLFFPLILIPVLALLVNQPLFAQDKEDNKTAVRDKKYHFILRLGQGGFEDDRSPLDKLGGGQLALDIKPAKIPFALSISSEYYTNSAGPTHPYEISGLVAVNVLYMYNQPRVDRACVFFGGGIGRLEVPESPDKPDAMVRDYLFDLEAGLHVRLYRNLGFYGTSKYLYARKDVDNVPLIDFSEFIILLGLTLTISL